MALCGLKKGLHLAPRSVSSCWHRRAWREAPCPLPLVPRLACTQHTLSCRDCHLPFSPISGGQDYTTHDMLLANWDSLWSNRSCPGQSKNLSIHGGVYHTAHSPQANLLLLSCPWTHSPDKIFVSFQMSNKELRSYCCLVGYLLVFCTHDYMLSQEFSWPLRWLEYHRSWQIQARLISRLGIEPNLQLSKAKGLFTALHCLFSSRIVPSSRL